MSQQQEVATERLVSIIQIIQLGRGTGLLTVRRGEGSNTEEGSIVFVNGQVTETKVGRQTGSKAFNNLSTWGSCVYKFSMSNVQEAPLTFPAAPKKTNPLPSPEASEEVFFSTSPLMRPFHTPALNTPPLEERDGHVPKLLPDQSFSMAMPYQTRPLDSALRMIESMKLSRIYRQIFLLVDGQRTIGEFVRITGRSQEEILTILRDLERIAVIGIANGRS